MSALTNSGLTVRLAPVADAAAIAAIYNEGIGDRIATFETEPRTAEQIRAQLADKGERFPTIVVERDGRVVAWAHAGAYRSRPAYAGVAEHSVYVARAARGTGAGRAAWTGSAGPTRIAGSGRSCRGSSRRTPRASRSIDAADSARSARTPGTASSKGSGATA